MNYATLLIRDEHVSTLWNIEIPLLNMTTRIRVVGISTKVMSCINYKRCTISAFPSKPKHTLYRITSLSEVCILITHLGCILRTFFLKCKLIFYCISSRIKLEIHSRGEKPQTCRPDIVSTALTRKWAIFELTNILTCFNANVA